jgi:cytochrome P450
VTASHRLIHRSSDKEDLYGSSDLLQWSDNLDCWLACDPAILIAILKNADFRVIDYEKETMKIVDGLGVDLLATANVARHLPLAREGCPHASLRKQMAVDLSRTAAPALLAFDHHLRTEVPRVFARSGEFEIVAELFAPLVGTLVTALSGARCDSDIGETSPSQLFDKFLSLNRRKMIDRQIRQICDHAGNGAASDDASRQAALVVLGFDSLLGSIGESFVHSIRSNPDKSMSEIAWSEKLPVTGVPYVDRVAVKPIEIGGQQVEEGQRVRLYLDAFGHAGPAHHDLYFGAGRHACLGRPLAQRAWQALTSNLATLRTRVAIVDVGYRTSDNVFNCPTSILVSVDEPNR